MKKSERISEQVAKLAPTPGCPLEPEYRGYFTHFNAGDYYEAHDVLEHLWLGNPGTDDRFFKGLIQVAGAFVHLQKQHLHPSHAKHGTRMRPAVRLFRLAVSNLAPFPATHRRLDVARVIRLCEDLAAGIERSGFTRNPWQPDDKPKLDLLPP